MNRLRVLDLFCGAGGASRGYYDGFTDGGYVVEVVGVDRNPQPSYPFEFVRADAFEFPLDGFDFIHASPPCQFATAYKRRPSHVAESPNLIPPTRERLVAAGVPYVIENVEGARPELVDPLTLCGSSFGLDVRRHRLFETSFPVLALPCDHGWQTPRFPPATNRSNLRSTVEVGVWRIPLDVQQRAMGVDWMERPELSQAIPPAYTAYLAAAALDVRAVRGTERCDAEVRRGTPHRGFYDMCWKPATEEVDGRPMCRRHAARHVGASAR